MRARLLGPVDAWCGPDLVELNGSKIRTVMAMLLLARGRVVEDATFTRMLWGADAPVTAPAQLQTYASRLRRMLTGHAEVVRQRPGYLLRMTGPSSMVDLVEFDALAARGRVELQRGNHLAATGSLAAAIELWQGPALVGVTEALSEAESPALLERRLSVVSDRIEADLALGRHAAVISELTGLVAAHPLRESLRGQLMRALYRCDRQADALRVYQEYRVRLADDLGIDPGPALQELHGALLRGDTAVAAPAPVTAVASAAPAAPADFTGREFELIRLRTALTAGNASGAAKIAAVVGLPGVGKTALALRVAHDIAADYPDGQVFVSLRDTEGRPRAAVDVLAEICATGGSPAPAPATTADGVRQYRGAYAGRRMLLVLDDAADEEQVRPLLQAPATCGVLVTSRAPLTALDGVRPLVLGAFAAGEATMLLARMAGETRVVADAAAAEAVAEACGYLPLAVRIAGARLAGRPHWPLANLAARLRDQSRTLDELTVADRSVRDALRSSVSALDDRLRVSLRQLAAQDTTAMTAQSAGRVLGLSPAEAEDRLDELAEAHLLTVDTTGARSVYRMPTLIRLYAREQGDRIVMKVPPARGLSAIWPVDGPDMERGRRVGRSIPTGRRTGC
ncbi:AfsR/SARP family transcriptional regulator [Actinoplanes sp. TRM 88003]|uniref:AfsR/SARP family transcriptional regulator n=1 Tax=Paractinoplanes aksuensis TaxID=2939490 RepID=A0ABT1DTR1_9ACTN|nr:BTAD domain-containing putative transcriptional regulator [Actinoplanes aksuensis]MCO8273913.1 AfsR/SARP family transcriptional regulator [Actinoplanes aksuensis]